VHGTNATESSGIKKNLKDLGSPNVSYNINISSDHDPQAISNALHGVLQDHANEIARHVSRVFRDDLQTQPA
jgi:capsular polysaccharide biosynthesis protein